MTVDLKEIGASTSVLSAYAIPYMMGFVAGRYMSEGDIPLMIACALMAGLSVYLLLRIGARFAVGRRHDCTDDDQSVPRMAWNDRQRNIGRVMLYSTFAVFFLVNMPYGYLMTEGRIGAEWGMVFPLVGLIVVIGMIYLLKDYVDGFRMGGGGYDSSQ